MRDKTEEMIGKTFGLLTVIGRGEPGIDGMGKKYGRLICICSCDGKEILVRNGDVRNGGKKSCGCLNALAAIKKMKTIPIGEIFGELTVIGVGVPFLTKDGRKMSTSHCKCTCGQETTIRNSDLRNGKSKSCGIARDLSGEVFGELVVLRRGENYIDTEGYPRETYMCICSCDPSIEFNVPRHALITDGKTHCGCKSGPWDDLVGQVFGRLTVIAVAAQIIDEYGAHSTLLCRCICGEEKTIRRNCLTQGNSKSCGNCIGKVNDSPLISNARTVYSSYNDGDISFDLFMFLSQLNCFYCGVAPHKYRNIYKDKRQTKYNSSPANFFVYNGLDRIDSKLPHNIDNVAPCCWDCNRAKRNMFLTDFLIYLYRLANHSTQSLDEHRISALNISVAHLYLPTTRVSVINRAFRRKNKHGQGYSDGDLSRDQYYQFSQLNCFYCGLEPSNLSERDGIIFVSSGLDRVDNYFRHDYDNVVACCKHCNFAKGKFHIENFLSWIDRLRNYIPSNLNTKQLLAG